MGLTFRGTKGSPLTQDELDQNFREYFNSASVENNTVSLFKPEALGAPVKLPFPSASGQDTWVQLKSGNNESGSNEFLTSSPNFRFNYSSSILYVTGTYQHLGNVNINGVLTAQEYVSTLVSSSVIYTSGSTQFGDTADDLHTFTGKVDIEGSENLVGPFTQSGDQKINGNQSFIGDKVQTGDYTLNGTLQHTGTATRNGALNQIGTVSVTGSILHQGSTTQNGNTEVYGNLQVNNNVKAGETSGNTHSFTGSLGVQGTASADYFSGDGSQVLNVITASYAISSSHTEQADNSLNADNATSASYALTASYVANASSFPFTGSAIISGALDVIGTVTGTTFKATGGVGVPTLTSANNIILSASNHIEIKDALLRVNSLSNTQTSSYTPSNGDIYYNTDSNLFLGRKDGQWIAFESQGAGIESILEDTTPQLGGNLDLNGNNISGSGTIDIAGDVTATNITGSSISSTGAITAGGDITAFFSSDERLKDNVTPIEGALDKINQIGGYKFDWNSNSEHSGHDVGVIAQEVEAVLPEVVATRDNGYKAVRYEKLVALLIEAVKEQQLQIEELKSKL